MRIEMNHKIPKPKNPMRKTGPSPEKRLKTLGPVSDLERHLPVEWWKTLFNAVYLKTDGDVVENKENTVNDIDRLILHADLKPEHVILDLCCGQGRHALELASRGFKNVVGLDRSRYLVRLAKRRAKQANLPITFREGDARKLRFPEGFFDCVAIMGNSFGYFEHNEDDRKVLSSIWRILKPGGRIVLDIVDGDWMREHFEPRSWEWIDQNQFVCRERSLANGGERLISREVVTHAERGIIVDQFYAERLYSLDGIKNALEELGFSEVTECESPTTLSSRQQDLGMLSKRIFIVACKPVKGGKRPRKAILYPKVTVILGDPSLPDAVKLKGVFSQEDLRTIGKMRDALTELSDFEFTFWDNHKNLHNLLATTPPDFVLNLCDEGFRNDPFKELHIPALLELYGIPYSGAGPQCLGLCYDKALVRAVAESMDIAVPLESYFSPDDQMATLPSIFPALVKPNFGDSSEGITKDAVVHDKEEFMLYWGKLRSQFPDRPLIVQEFLNGREYSVGIIGNAGMGYRVLPVLEVDYSKLDESLPRILGYESKWIPDSPYWNDISYMEAKLNESDQRALVDAAFLLFERLGCRDYARFDFRTDAEGRIKLLEVNPNPGWCWDGKLNIMAGMAGLSYPDLLREIIESAQSRYGVTHSFGIGIDEHEPTRHYRPVFSKASLKR